MYRPNPLNSKLQNAQPLLGLWHHLSSPIAAEIIALAGYDFVVVDHEHGPGHYLDATSVLQAMSGTPVASFIRVPWNDHVHLKRALDCGVDGVVIPYVCNAEEAKRAVQACFYPPKGNRGMAHVLCRASDYGIRAEEYAQALEENLTIACMIETVEGVRRVPEIAAVDGVSVIFIGSYDLSCSMGIAGRFDDSNYRALLNDAESAVRESGKILGGIPTPTDDVHALYRRGYQFVVGKSDVMLLRDAARDYVSRNRAS